MISDMAVMINVILNRAVKGNELLPWHHRIPMMPYGENSSPFYGSVFKGRISPFLFLKETIFELHGIFYCGFYKI